MTSSITVRYLQRKSKALGKPILVPAEIKVAFQNEELSTLLHLTIFCDCYFVNKMFLNIVMDSSLFQDQTVYNFVLKIIPNETSKTN